MKRNQEYKLFLGGKKGVKWRKKGHPKNKIEGTIIVSISAKKICRISSEKKNICERIAAHIRYDQRKLDVFKV